MSSSFAAPTRVSDGAHGVSAQELWWRLATGGALSPLVFGFLVQYGNWQAPFIVAAALLVIGAAVWAFWLDPNRSVLGDVGG